MLIKIQKSNLNIPLQTFKRPVLPSMVYRYTDSRRNFLRNASCLEFIQCEAPPQSQPVVVPDSLAVYRRSEHTGDRSRSDTESSFLTGLASAFLSACLIEPGAYTCLPVFVEMRIRQHSISLTHH